MNVGGLTLLMQSVFQGTCAALFAGNEMAAMLRVLRMAAQSSGANILAVGLEEFCFVFFPPKLVVFGILAPLFSSFFFFFFLFFLFLSAPS